MLENHQTDPVWGGYLLAENLTPAHPKAPCDNVGTNCNTVESTVTLWGSLVRVSAGAWGNRVSYKVLA
jgi:hypothetical protein